MPKIENKNFIFKLVFIIFLAVSVLALLVNVYMYIVSSFSILTVGLCTFFTVLFAIIAIYYQIEAYHLLTTYEKYLYDVEDENKDEKNKFFNDLCETTSQHLRQSTQNYFKYVFTFSSAALGVFLTLMSYMFNSNQSSAIKLILKESTSHIFSISCAYIVSIILIIFYQLFNKTVNNYELVSRTKNYKDTFKKKNNYFESCAILCELIIFFSILIAVIETVILFANIFKGISI